MFDRDFGGNRPCGLSGADTRADWRGKGAYLSSRLGRQSAAIRAAAALLDHARAIGADLWRFGHDFNYQGDRQQWAYAGRHSRRASLPYPALRGANQLLNASGVLATLEALASRLPVSQQAVRQGLLTVQLPARFQVLPGRPAIVLDVAHNPHAAAVLAQNLDMMGFYPQTHAVFGMLSDKDIGGVVAKVGNKIDHWYAAPTSGARGASAADIARHVRRSCQPPR